MFSKQRESRIQEIVFILTIQTYFSCSNFKNEDFLIKNNKYVLFLQEKSNVLDKIERKNLKISFVT